MLDWLKASLLAILPHHALSRLIYRLTRMEGVWVTPVIRYFVAFFNVEMKDAVQPDITQYKSFNTFFTRSLKPDARPITTGPYEVACPADGCVSAIGRINHGRILQAKGKDYTVSALLTDESLANKFANGSFATVYLSPRDYHRLHMPVSGTLLSQTHVPGRLYSVAPHTVRNINAIFARNERVVAHFATEYGNMALVLVGAINVAAIETVWHGLVTPPAGKQVTHWNYADETAVSLQRGEEMGRFNMGSTIIALFDYPIQWRIDVNPDDAVRMGQFMGRELRS